MPFAYLRKMRAEEERQRSRSSSRSTPEVGSPNRAIKIGLLAILTVPVLLHLPWLHSALGPGGLPDLWVRPAGADAAGAGAGAGRGVDCYIVPGGEEFRFCEDLHSIPGAQKETVLISCDANRGGWNTVMGPLSNPEARGMLFTYEYPTSVSGVRGQAIPVDLINYPQEKQFHPLGLSMYHPKGQTGQRTLFVINHGKLRSSVEIFDLIPRTEAGEKEGGEGWEAHWLKSVEHPLATHTPNSIHALSETRFVVTHDHLFARRPGPLHSHTIPLLSQLFFGNFEVEGWRGWVVETVAKVANNRKVAAVFAQIETLLGLPLGWLTLAELEEGGGGVKAKLLARGIPFANGLAITPDEKVLIVAATTYPGVWIYDILPPASSSFYTSSPEESFGWDSGLRLKTKLHLPFRVDNLAFTTQPTTRRSSDIFSGYQLLATGHPAPLKLIGMARNPRNKTSPSWSVAITPSHNAAQGKDSGEWEDKAAPLPAHHFVLSHNSDWRIRTLLQSKGEQVEVGKQEKVRVASSASAFYHPYSEEGGGLLMVSGLYGEVTACMNVAT